MGGKLQRRTKYLIFLLPKKRKESSGSGRETPRPPLPRPLASPSQPRRAPLTKRRCPNSRPFSHPLMLDSPWRPRAGSSPSSGRCQPSSFSPVTLRCTARQHFALQPPPGNFPTLENTARPTYFLPHPSSSRAPHPYQPPAKFSRVAATAYSRQGRAGQAAGAVRTPHRHTHAHPTRRQGHADTRVQVPTGSYSHH